MPEQTLQTFYGNEFHHELPSLVMIYAIAFILGIRFREPLRKLIGSCI